MHFPTLSSISTLLLLLLLTLSLTTALPTPAADPGPPGSYYTGPWDGHCRCWLIGTFCDSNWSSKNNENKALFGPCNFHTLYTCTEIHGVAQFLRKDKIACPQA